ncbi:chromate resistance protein ChrB domain-containing protein [Mucilaginibacter flavidus]|uniref:chromate resistance protein ChrB domain-containing protein n=1 Tax=Mucilaginibacter flavidus TaxID=2949309 RepID=UPI002092D481|nr:chromate resistance protein ChrB domain-containing protein [Mucilaginibacter flavidus]MCO5946672.1 chromate resistance protein [Mucilaginibacter flavidus]
MKWITRERPKIDRIACPWLIKNFVDRDAEFVFVPAEEVIERAKKLNAIAYDIGGVEYTHEGEFCTFDYILKKHELTDPALLQIGLIVRGADTARFDLAQQAAGLWAISAGLSHNFKDDHEQLATGMIIYDALYSWAKYVQEEKHTWQSS